MAQSPSRRKSPIPSVGGHTSSASGEGRIGTTVTKGSIPTVNHNHNNQATVTISNTSTADSYHRYHHSSASNRRLSRPATSDDARTVTSASTHTNTSIPVSYPNQSSDQNSQRSSVIASATLPNRSHRPPSSGGSNVSLSSSLLKLHTPSTSTPATTSSKIAPITPISTISTTTPTIPTIPSASASSSAPDAAVAVYSPPPIPYNEVFENALMRAVLAQPEPAILRNSVESDVRREKRLKTTMSSWMSSLTLSTPAHDVMPLQQQQQQQQNKTTASRTTATPVLGTPITSIHTSPTTNTTTPDASASITSIALPSLNRPLIPLADPRRTYAHPLLPPPIRLTHPDGHLVGGPGPIPADRQALSTAFASYYQIHTRQDWNRAIQREKVELVRRVRAHARERERAIDGNRKIEKDLLELVRVREREIRDVSNVRAPTVGREREREGGRDRDRDRERERGRERDREEGPARKKRREDCVVI